MHPLSDKDLDRLSREAAEQFDVEQNTSGWDKLEQKLNKQLPQKSREERRRFLFFIWIFALLSGAGLLWMLTSNESSSFITLKEGSSEISPTKPASTTVPDKNTVDAATGQEDRGKARKKSLPAEPGVKVMESPEAATTANEGQEKSSVKPNEKIALPGSNASSKKVLTRTNKRSSNQLSNTTGKNRMGEKTSKSGPMAPAIVSNSPDQPSANKLKTEKNTVDESLAPAINGPVTPPLTQNTDDIHPVKTETQGPGADSAIRIKKTASAASKNGFTKGFEFGVLGAVDMSNVKFTHSDNPGFGVGIQLGYRLSQKWSVITGVIYTKKNYTSPGEEFNPPKGTWLDNVTLDEVEGSCYMFDIPVNVRYDLNANGKSRYFLSTGLSTYLMKKEQYHYYYAYPNGSPGYRYRDLSSSDHHWFSILNVSAGFEKKLNKRFSIQAEPYLKIPLTGIGYGNLSLNSYGLYFLVKYQGGKR